MKKLFLAIGVGLAALGLSAVMAATTVVVTPTNTQDWSTADTNAGGTVTFVADSMAPAGAGALKLTTDSTTTAKAHYLHAANTPLASVNDLSYYTKQNSASFVGGDPSYQVVADLNGTTGFTTLVFEPYQNPTEGAVVPGSWQQWNVQTGLFWSTRTVTCSNGTIIGSAGGPASYTLAQISSMCPSAMVIGFGVNVGSNNVSYDVETDLVHFNSTTYDLEPYVTASNKDQCKDGGWQTAHRADGTTFKNQGDCVSYTNTGR